MSFTSSTLHFPSVQSCCRRVGTCKFKHAEQKAWYRFRMQAKRSLVSLPCRCSAESEQPFPAMDGAVSAGSTGSTSTLGVCEIKRIEFELISITTNSVWNAEAGGAGRWRVVLPARPCGPVSFPGGRGPARAENAFRGSGSLVSQHTHATAWVCWLPAFFPRRMHAWLYWPLQKQQAGFPRKYSDF